MPTLEELFDRFRRAGDADALGEVYDRVAAQLLRSAMHVAPSPASAEDLLQATFVAAIERRDSYDAARPLVPWLLGILANQARLSRWRDGRTPDPQRLAPASARDPLELAQETEFTAALDEAIAALPEVYQPVLVLHLRHGMPGIEIAHALRRPPGTVRAQLARGLDKLRAALPAGIAGALAITTSASRGLAAVRAAVVAHASATTTTVLPALATPSMLGLLVMKKALLVLAAGAAVVGLWWASAPASDPLATESIAASDGMAIAAAADAAREDPAASPSAQGGLAPRERAAISADRGFTASQLLDGVTPMLRGVVRYAEDGAPAPGVSVWCEDVRNSEGERLGARADETGRFDFGRLLIGPYRLGTDRGGERSLDLRADTGEIELQIPAACLVTGTVRDPDRHAVRGAQIWLSERFGLETGAIVATTDDDGRFRVRAVSPERWIGARADGYRPSHVHYVQAAAGETVELDLTVALSGARMRGHVLDARGRAVASARVRVSPPGRAPYVSTGTGSVVRAYAPALAVSDADGAFELNGLPPGLLSVQARAKGRAAFDGEIEIAAGATGYVTATLPELASVRGRVTNASGDTVAGAHLRVARAWDDFLRSYALTDQHGEYTIEVATPREAVLAVMMDGHIAAQTTLRVEPGQTARWDPVLGTRPAITGRVVDSAHRPLRDWRVSALRNHEPVANAVTDEQGRFDLLDLEPEPHEVAVSRVARSSSAIGASGSEITALAVTDIPPGGPELLFEVPLASVVGTTLRGRALGPDGTAMAGARIRIGNTEGKGVIHLRADARSGAFEVGDLIPGPYWISAHSDGHPAISVGRRELGAGEETDLGDLVFAVGGRVTGSLRGADPATLAHVELEIVDAEQESSGGTVQLDDARFRSSDLPPGRYRLLLRGPGLAAAATPFEIIAGVETTCDVVVTPGARHSLRLRLPAGEPPPRWIWMTLMRGEEILGGQECVAQPDGTYTAELWLGPGTYDAWMGDPARRCHGHCTLTVPADVLAPGEIPVQLERK